MTYQSATQPSLLVPSPTLRDLGWGLGFIVIAIFVYLFIFNFMAYEGQFYIHMQLYISILYYRETFPDSVRENEGSRNN